MSRALRRRVESRSIRLPPSAQSRVLLKNRAVTVESVVRRDRSLFEIFQGRRFSVKTAVIFARNKWLRSLTRYLSSAQSLSMQY
jgi:hypothetical protein